LVLEIFQYYGSLFEITKESAMHALREEFGCDMVERVGIDTSYVVNKAEAGCYINIQRTLLAFDGVNRRMND
jgi:hypothetical protein